MARPRLPSTVLDARGAFKKNPQRKRADEPEANGAIGGAPECLDEKQREAWSEIVGNAHDGVFCVADRIAVEMAARLLAEYREKGVDFSAERQKSLIALLSRFGMTPSDRSRVVVPKKAASNPFDAIIKGKKL